MNAINQLTDSELIQKVSELEIDAVQEIYDRYSPIVFTLIYKIVADQKLAEEILTDVFLITSKKYSKLNFNSNNVYTWLLTLARNKAVDGIRRQRNSGTVEEYTDEYEDRYILPRLAEGINPVNLDDVLNDKERIVAAIDSMTDAQKYVLELAYYEGLTEKEIAKKLNIPFQTVRSKIQIALSNLKNKLK